MKGIVIIIMIKITISLKTIIHRLKSAILLLEALMVFCSVTEVGTFTQKPWYPLHTETTAKECPAIYKLYKSIFSD